MILESWKRNAQAWSEAVRAQQIQSRRECTDEAILQAVLQSRAVRVVDLGCGEGWLCRQLESHGLSVLGVDATESLLPSRGNYRCLSYAQLDQLEGDFELAVCNFSLFTPLQVQQVAAWLPRHTALLIQTLPAPRRSHWKPGSWSGLPGAFVQPYSYYAFSRASWGRHLGRSLDFRETASSLLLGTAPHFFSQP